MRIAFIGAGALGSLFGGLLAGHGHRVWLYNRSYREHIHAIQERGLRLQTEEGERTIDAHAVSRVEGIREPPELIAITVKAHDSEAAARDARTLLEGDLEGDAPVLSLQNGAGVEHLIARQISPSRILRGVTSQGSTLVAPGVVRWAGRGPTWIGPLQAGTAGPGRIDEIVRTLNSAEIETYYEREIERRVWEKLLINAAINPLTALFAVENGTLVENDELRRVTHDLVHETLAVLRQRGITLAADEAIDRVEGVCRATARNLSSMFQDVRRGKRTEVDFINGAIVAEAERIGLSAPLNRALTALVHRLERCEP